MLEATGLNHYFPTKIVWFLKLLCAMGFLLFQKCENITKGETFTLNPNIAEGATKLHLPLSDIGFKYHRYHVENTLRV